MTDALAARRNVNARVEDAETLIVALTERCDALLMAGKTLSGRVAQLEDRVQGYGGELGEHQVLVATLKQRLKMLEEHYIAFRQQHVTFLQRLRWMLRG